MACSNKYRTIITFLYVGLLFCPLVNCHNLLVPRPLAGNDNTTCSNGTLKLNICADLLNWLINIRVGTPPTKQCCPLIQGLIDLEAAICLCAAIRANVLGIITIDLNLALTLLLSVCGKNLPSGFQCQKNDAIIAH